MTCRVAASSSRKVTVTGASATVTLDWTTTLTGDPLPLAVVVDPFGAVPETDKANNRAAFAVRHLVPLNLAVRGRTSPSP
jgi:hypothetical protein